MSSQTNVSAVLLTLNESDVIEDTLHSASPCFDELVLVDGRSEDNTVELAQRWCEEEGKKFTLVKSSEKEYLLAGVGSQRRKGEDAASNEYIFSLDAASKFELKDPTWFQEGFEYNVYAHTKVLQCGYAGIEHKLYKLYPAGVSDRYIDAPRMRGMVREELYTSDGAHVSEVFTSPEAPLTVHKQRKEILERETAYPKFLHYRDVENAENNLWKQKKQHFLLRQAMGSEQQSAYLDDRWKRYFGQNYEIIHNDWKDIAEEYHFPKIGADASERDLKLNRSVKIRKSPWDLETYEGNDPVNKMEYKNIFGYIKGEVIN
jgi:glycosyltransferase involved in cell wall biosynthesis